jgi:PLP dependent protein
LRGAGPLGAGDLAGIVDGVEAGQRAWAGAVYGSCAGGAGLTVRARIGDEQPAPGDPSCQRLTFPLRQGIVAHHHADPARQTVDRGPHIVALAFVGQHPDARQSEVATVHRAAYSAAMPEAERLTHVHERIARAAKVARRNSGDVTLIAVSKTHPIERIVPLIEAGQRVFGENRVQEAEAKWPELRAQYGGTELHLVGQLQSNKADAAVRLFDAIHSLDRPSLIDALARAIGKAGRSPTLFAQVNIGDEPQKGGCPVAEVPQLLATAQGAGLTISGLMCVPPAEVEAAPYFALLAKIARDQGVPLLSVGMSEDFETAVMLGATHVRVGSALFGPRE